MSFDVIVKNGRWFDGTGAASAVRSLGVRDGRVVEISETDLDEAECPRVIDAAGHWVIPGMVDIHTHYDVEVLVQPALVESLRHGVTTILLGSCSLSTVHASPSDAGDLFGRVEAIPRPYVVGALDDTRTWTTAGEYVAALEALPLGPNVAAFIGHSDIRAARMGLERSTDAAVRPTAAELAQMEADLVDALDAGFVGMSSQQLMFDKLDGETCRSRTLPSTYARRRSGAASTRYCGPGAARCRADRMSPSRRAWS
ncbi:amidohydrolase family protein, partial [Nocardioides sp. GCM10030258]|uniref:amidohydrolase family protein n=1 Tax=unclassified Nocardioides TaxID=2615069 RepID=UPI00360EAF4E